MAPSTVIREFRCFSARSALSQPIADATHVIPAIEFVIGEVELATLTWVHWFNEHRLHSHCGDIPPAEFEAAFYAAQQPSPTGTPAGVGNQ